ncbi:hypothetical protein EW146_g5621 [Bondarzewia mesenterica]|uniref:Dystroglycan-type cadherin-like domain-containing protein n=1 Tax=Bondarzewia mesenterica TaxID=1095465 RepID=A0A4S4LQX4_9AGAM|nr:hypothetical protein EW146_g5621 [Bondarzewia mesenterica]
MSPQSGFNMFVLSVVSCLFIPQCVAQEKAFQWSFVDSAQSTGLTECQSMDIVVRSLTGNSSSVGQSPYYMVAYEADGMATVSPIGSDPSQLSWEVNHRAGTEVILSVVDSAGNSGGVASSAFTVKDGSSSCLPAVPMSLPQVNANVTKDLNTCEPLGLFMGGGVPPYTVSIAQMGGFVTNVTLGPQDNMYTWINQASPNSELLLTVSDSNGQWAAQSVIISTIGSSDTACPGLTSISGSTLSQAISGKSASNHHTAIIIGVCLGVTVLVLVFCLVLVFVFLRMRPKRSIVHGQDTAPRSWLEDTLVSRSGAGVKTTRLDGPKHLTIDMSAVSEPSHRHPRSTSIYSPYSARSLTAPSPVFPSSAFTSIDVLDISASNRPSSPTANTASHSGNQARPRPSPPPPPSVLPSHPTPIPPQAWPDHRIPRPPPVSPLSWTSSPSSSRATSPVRPLPHPPNSPSRARSRKAREAASERQLRSVRSAGDVRRFDEPGVHLPSRAMQDASLSRARSLVNMNAAFSGDAVRQSWTQDARGRDMVIIQHRDAIVQELPPPYDEIRHTPSPWPHFSP